VGDTLHVGKTVSAVNACQLERLASRNLASYGSVHQLFPSADLVSNVTDAVPFSCFPPRVERAVHQELVNQHPLDRH
jgi:hypothetical protein